MQKVLHCLLIKLSSSPIWHSTLVEPPFTHTFTILLKSHIELCPKPLYILNWLYNKHRNQLKHLWKHHILLEYLRRPQWTLWQKKLGPYQFFSHKSIGGLLSFIYNVNPLFLVWRHINYHTNCVSSVTFPLWLHNTVTVRTNLMSH